MSNPIQKLLSLSIRNRTYAKVKAKIKPLDLLIFRGSDIQSNVILLSQTLEIGHVLPLFSHAALVVTKEVLPHIPQLEKGKLYVWECTLAHSNVCKQFNAMDVEHPDTGSSGVQIRELESVLKVCQQINEVVCWCPLINNPWNKNTRKSIQTKLTKFHQQFGNCGYDFNMFDLMGAVFQSSRTIRDAVDSCIYRLIKGTRSACCGQKHDGSIEQEIDSRNPLRRFFCSELVASIYQLIGIIPADFDGKLKTFIIISPGCIFVWLDLSHWSDILERIMKLILTPDEMQEEAKEEYENSEEFLQDVQLNRFFRCLHDHSLDKEKAGMAIREWNCSMLVENPETYRCLCSYIHTEQSYRLLINSYLGTTLKISHSCFQRYFSKSFLKSIDR